MIQAILIHDQALTAIANLALCRLGYVQALVPVIILGLVELSRLWKCGVYPRLGLKQAYTAL